MYDWILSSSVLIAAVILLRLLFKKHISAGLRYALWGLVLLRLLIPGSLFHSGLSVENLTITVSQQPQIQAITQELNTPQQSYESVYDAVYQEMVIQQLPEAETVPPTLPAAQQAQIEQEVAEKLSKTTPLYSLKQILATLWCIGMAVTAAVLLTVNGSYAGLLRRSCQPMAADTPVPVYSSRIAETPCLFGLFRPAIYVTPEIGENKAILGHILAHETTHYRHKDHIWAFLRCVCLVLHWYNPLVWVALSLSRRDCELACDEATLRRIGPEQRIDYGKTLLEMTCVKRAASASLITATTMLSDKKTVTERVRRVAKQPKVLLTAVIGVVLVAAVVIACVFTGAREKQQASTEYPLKDAEFGASTVADAYSFRYYPAESYRHLGAEAEAKIAQLDPGYLYVLDTQSGEIQKQLDIPIRSYTECAHYFFCLLEDQSILAAERDGDLRHTLYQATEQIAPHSLKYIGYDDADDYTVNYDPNYTEDVLLYFIDGAKIMVMDLRTGVAETLFTYEGAVDAYRLQGKLSDFMLIRTETEDIACNLVTGETAVIPAEDDAALDQFMNNGTWPGSTQGLPEDMYPSGNYTIGKADAPAPGEYIFQPYVTATAELQIRCADGNEQRFHVTDHFYWQLEAGDTVTLTGGYFTESARNTAFENDQGGYDTGMYRIGVDIPEGQYLLSPTREGQPVKWRLFDAIHGFQGSGISESPKAEVLDLTGKAAVWVVEGTLMPYSVLPPTTYQPIRFTNYGWIHEPQPTSEAAVRQALANAVQENYILAVNILSVAYDPELTQINIDSLKGSDLAKSAGLTDEILENHFQIVQATWRYVCDPFIPNPHYTTATYKSHFSLLQDSDTGLWRIWEFLTPYNTEDPGRTPGTFTQEDITAFTYLLTQEGNTSGTGAVNYYNRLLASTFATPAEAELLRMFYDQNIDEAAPLTEGERSFLAQQPQIDLNLSVVRISASRVEAVLRQHLGLTLADTGGMDPAQFVYFPDTDCWYHSKGDAGIVQLAVTGGQWLEENLVEVYYNNLRQNMVLTLRWTATGYTVISNLPR